MIHTRIAWYFLHLTVNHCWKNQGVPAYRVKKRRKGKWLWSLRTCFCSGKWSLYCWQYSCHMSRALGFETNWGFGCCLVKDLYKMQVRYLVINMLMMWNNDMRCYVVFQRPTCCCFNHLSNFTTSDHECNTFPRNHRFRFINKHWLMDNFSFFSRAERGIYGYRGVVFVLLHQLLSCGILRDTMILLMEEILHHMTCMKPCK